MINDLSQRVVAGNKTTYADLLKQIFPDFAGKEQRITRSIRLRSILSPGVQPNQEIDVGVFLDHCQGLWFSNGGKRHLALLIRLRRAAPLASTDNFFFVLAAFSLDNGLALTEVVDVKPLSYRYQLNLWEESPLMPILEGEDAIWLIGMWSDSGGNPQRKYSLLTLQNNHFTLVLDGLPTVTDSSGWFVDDRAKRATRFEAKQRLNIIFPKSNPAYYRPFALEIVENLRTFDVPYQSGAIVIDPNDPPPDYDKISTYQAVWDNKLRRYKLTLEQETAAFVPLTKDSGKFAEIAFHGQLEVGRIYRAAITRSRGIWKLLKPLKFPLSQTIEVEFDDREGILKSLKNNAQARFLVVKKTTRNRVGKQSLTVFELKILSVI